MRTRPMTRPASSTAGLLALWSAIALVAAGIVAALEPVPRWELRLTETINDLPDAVATTLWPVMQLGTLAAPLLAGVFVLIVARDRRRAVVTVLAGVAAWIAAKGVKQVFERGRPKVFLPEIQVREGDGTGLGFVSGHSAVAAACAVCVASVLPARLRFLPALVAVVVGIARIVHGVHLPADVVGGWALGALIALGFLWLADRSGPEVANETPPNTHW